MASVLVGRHRLGEQASQAASRGVAVDQLAGVHDESVRARQLDDVRAVEGEALGDERAVLGVERAERTLGHRDEARLRGEESLDRRPGSRRERREAPSEDASASASRSSDRRASRTVVSKA